MRLYLFPLLAIPLVTAHAYAGAWLQPRGKGQIIMTGLYYSTDQLFDIDGKKTVQARYMKRELNPYIEYGLRDNITVGANLSLQKTSHIAETNYGIGDSEFFARKQLLKWRGLRVAVEPLLKLPRLASSSDFPKIGSDYPDTAMTLSAGYGFSALGRNHFADVDAGYRRRLGLPQDQIKIAATVGIGITPTWMLMPQAFLTYRVTQPSIATFTQTSDDDYQLAKIQLSGVYKLRDDVSLQFGAFSHIRGQNVGAGDGALFAVWKQF